VHHELHFFTLQHGQLEAHALTSTEDVVVGNVEGFPEEEGLFSRVLPVVAVVRDAEAVFLVDAIVGCA
jgi:hypothetical protein